MSKQSIVYAFYIVILGLIVFKAGMDRSEWSLMLASAISPLIAYRVAKARFS